MQLIDALKQLDKNDDDSWTSDGQPRLELVKKALGRSVSRSDIASAVPGFNRGYVFDGVETQDTAKDSEPAEQVEQTETEKAEDPKPAQDEKQKLQAALDAAQAAIVKAEKDFIAAQAAMDAYIIDNQGAVLSHAEQVKAYQKASKAAAAEKNEMLKATAKLINGQK